MPPGRGLPPGKGRPRPLPTGAGLGLAPRLAVDGAYFNSVIDRVAMKSPASMR